MDVGVLLVDKNGVELWKETYNNAQYETVGNLKEAGNGSVVLSGSVEDRILSTYDANNDQHYLLSYKILIKKINFNNIDQTENPNNSLALLTITSSLMILIVITAVYIITKSYKKRLNNRNLFN